MLSIDEAKLRNLIWDTVVQAHEFVAKNAQPATPSNPDRFLNTKEAYIFLRCSRQSLYDLRTKKGLTFTKRGRTILYKLSDLESFLKPINLKR